MRLSAILLALSLPTPLLAQGLHLIPGVREIESDSIRDIAVAAVDADRPVVYYNPVMANRYGPLLTRFFLAHEYGHIQYHHTRAGLADLADSTRESIFRAQELAADCYAASLAGDDARAATEAALRFFSRLGPFRFDAEHPTGAQRAARILMCLPGPRPTVVYGRGETGVEVGPVSGEPDRVLFEVTTEDLARRFGGNAVLWLDGQRVGQLSNLRFPRTMSVDQFGAGIHTYRIEVEVFDLEQNPSGRLSGRGHVLIQNGDRFRIVWSGGETPQLVREDSGK
ncbi:MAG TPA: hypothetical protein VLD58_05080 [Gemmatimonadales bacterium]|nr:hypothetical protein [Gemmatimonadales bacterium]